jgi:hypothetical protein
LFTDHEDGVPAAAGAVEAARPPRSSGKPSSPGRSAQHGTG